MLKHPEKKISVLIVDDHPPLRAGVRAMLEKTPDIYVIGEAGSGEEAERLLDELRPHIILLDLKMPNFSPSAFEKWARENYPETITLVLTAHDRDAYLASMMEAGAVGFLDKEARAEQLIEAIRRAASGESLYDEWQKKRAHKWREEVEKRWSSLSERERQVLRLLAEGLNNRDIASRLGITIKTLDKHFEKIYQKLEVTSRTEAALWGKEHMGDFPY
ncbi:MAG: response regulator [Chloroflexota bacterium]|nr:response regulator transcription factor [Chloroflexota bacterium]MBI5705160.1 response regulator transcription factor [Chloroflexota bacterium]